MQNKGQSVLCIPNGNVDSPLHTGLPCWMPQKSDWWPPGQLEPQSAGQGSQPRVWRVKKWTIPAPTCACHCPERGTAQASHAQGPHRAEALHFLRLLRDGHCSWQCVLQGFSEARDTGGGPLRRVWRTWESHSQVPIPALPLPGCVVLGMLFNLLLNLNFLICKTGNIST